MIDKQRATIQDKAPRPQWLDEKLYPFRSRFVEIEGKTHPSKSVKKYSLSTTTSWARTGRR